MITQGEEFEKLVEHVRRAQEACANLSHLAHAMYDDKRKAEQWMKCSELFKELVPKITAIATQGRQ